MYTSWETVLQHILFLYRKPWSWDSPVSDAFAADWVLYFRKWMAARKKLFEARAAGDQKEVRFWIGKIQEHRSIMKHFARRRTCYQACEGKFKKRPIDRGKIREMLK